MYILATFCFHFCLKWQSYLLSLYFYSKRFLWIDVYLNIKYAGIVQNYQFPNSSYYREAKLDTSQNKSFNFYFQAFNTLGIQHKPGRSKFAITIDVAKYIFKMDGIAGFYRGYFASLSAYVPNSALWWGFYHFYQGLCFFFQTTVRPR